MSGAVSFLREFNPPGDAPALESPRSVEEAYRAGLLEGREQAQSESQAMTLEAISDLKFALDLSIQARDEMRLAAQADAGKAVAAVVRSLCPHLAKLGLADAGQDLMSGTLKNVPRPLTINVAPQSIDPITEALGDSVGTDVEIRERDGLTESRIVIDWMGGSAEIDFDAITSRIVELAGELDPSEVPTEESTSI